MSHQVDAMVCALQGLARLHRQPPRPVHTEAAHTAITAELVRVTLGGKPGRPELEVPA